MEKFINLYSGTWIKGINEGLIFSSVYSEIKTQYFCGILTKQSNSINRILQERKNHVQLAQNHIVTNFLIIELPKFFFQQILFMSRVFFDEVVQKQKCVALSKIFLTENTQPIWSQVVL